MTEQGGEADRGCAVAGYQYQEPDVHCYDADDEVVRERLFENDPDITSLKLWLDAFRMMVPINVGRALLHNTCLQKLKIQYLGYYPDEQLLSFCRKLAQNRSLMHLAMIGFCYSDFDLFLSLSPFPNLRCIEISSSEMSENFPSFISALSQSRTNRLERIDISECRIGDKQVVSLVNALNEMAGLS